MPGAIRSLAAAFFAAAVAIYSGMPIVSATAAPSVPCPSATPVTTGLATIAVDPATPVSVRTGQEFIIAMRGGAGDSPLQPYRMRATPNGSVVAFDKAFTIDDVTFTNADTKPGDAMLADGPATQYFAFRTTAHGTTTVTFDEFAIGNDTVPVASKTFTIVSIEYLSACAHVNTVQIVR